MRNRLHAKPETATIMISELKMLPSSASCVDIRRLTTNVRTVIEPQMMSQILRHMLNVSVSCHSILGQDPLCQWTEDSPLSSLKIYNKFKTLMILPGL